ncbi:bifunctional 3-(3-hydroxy-phenyl)propionate/3-hydroxycinnamic acid hydroxylase [Polymorphospora rubra]|uniref:bifunctional 3-(3-hydroxy-phenyl)propionate/3-hydroxycinnamic acid hydroxylase MhpA n=1 Tax=Polymorphospora rubra TaxID=338584 RepID=UPI0033D953BB
MATTDVLIVGYGPVGQVLTILLAQRGFTVQAIDKWLTPYNFPRAVTYDGEASRILAACGTGAELDPVVELSGEYTWKNAFGRTLLHVKVAENGPTGWPDSTSFYQPGLEARLAERGGALPGVDVRRGEEVTGLRDRDDHVEVTVVGGDGTEEVRTARWVVGCDGANSFVRGHLGAAVVDLDFTHDWLVCDVVPHEAVEFKPNNLQICDPGRPRTAVSAGPGHRRWEFMRVPGESREEFESLENVWRLLGLFGITAQNATLERYGVYTTQACYADRWRSGRILLAGDAAHVMPPFLGQGMSSGFRDAMNLAWKLDLVRRGLAGADLLDTYQRERQVHVQHAIRMSRDSGTVICETDRTAAAGRDAVMLAALRRRTQQRHARSLREPIVDGVLRRAVDGSLGTGAGEPVPQGRVAVGDRTGRFDAVVGTGFVLIVKEGAEPALDPDRTAFLDALGALVVRVAPDRGPASDAVVDLDGVYLPWLAGHEADVALVRPDFYVFGTATADDLPALVDDLREQVRFPVPHA